MNRKSFLIACGVISLALLANIVSQLYVRDFRRQTSLIFEAPRAGLPPDLIRILAGEFNGVLADYLVLEVGSFIGSDQKISIEEYQKIHRGLKQALALDPYFEQIYLLAQGILPWKDEMVRQTIEILDTARQYRAWDWRPGYYMGFNYYYFLNDFGKASEAFLGAGEKKGAPVLLSILGARFAAKAQRTSAAISVLQQMLADETMNESDRLEIEQRLIALQGIQQLEKFIVRYKEQTNHYPSKLEDLLLHGIIPELPKNPYGKTFYYDPKTGQVAFDRNEIKTGSRPEA